METEQESLSPPEVPADWWQTLEARWRTVLGLEATIESWRMKLEGVRSQLESESRRSLSVDEKVHALQGDVGQWNKAKNRVHYAVPKVREFIHRATWALGVPERKKLAEIFETYIGPRLAFPELDKVPEMVDSLLKDRQILAGQGAALDQECRTISAEIQRAYRTLQTNAASRARQKKDAMREKGKHL